MSSVYGKVPISSGHSQILDIGGSGLSGVLIANESGLTCTVEMQGANVKRSLYAGTVDFFPVQKGVNWSGNLVVTPSADLNNINFWPSSFIQIDTFGLSEHPHGTYPMNLNRTGNVGNQVTTAVGSATSVQNDNNAANTVFVEGTVIGSPQSNVSIDNSGNVSFGRWINPTFTKVFQILAAGTTALKLGAVGTFLTQVLGNLQVDGTASFNGGGATIDGSSNFNGNAVNTNNVNTGVCAASTLNSTNANSTGLSSFDSLSVTNAATVNGNIVGKGSSSLDNGLLTTDGSGHVTANTFNLAGAGADFNLLLGSISRIHSFNAALINGKLTVAHGLGAIPDIIIITPRLSGIPSNATYGYNPATIDGTNVDLWANLGFNATVLAIRF